MGRTGDFLRTVLEECVQALSRGEVCPPELDRVLDAWIRVLSIQNAITETPLKLTRGEQAAGRTEQSTNDFMRLSQNKNWLQRRAVDLEVCVAAQYTTLLRVGRYCERLWQRPKRRLG